MPFAVAWPQWASYKGLVVAVGEIDPTCRTIPTRPKQPKLRVLTLM